MATPAAASDMAPGEEDLFMDSFSLGSQALEALDKQALEKIEQCRKANVLPPKSKESVEKLVVLVTKVPDEKVNVNVNKNRANPPKPSAPVIDNKKRHDFVTAKSLLPNKTTDNPTKSEPKRKSPVRDVAVKSDKEKLKHAVQENASNQDSNPVVARHSDEGKSKEEL